MKLKSGSRGWAARVMAPTERNQWLMIFGMTFVAQLLLASINFPASELFTRNPLFYIDSPYHWYNMELAANLAPTGNVTGYDPFFDAGHLDGVFYYHSGRVPAFFAALLSPTISELSVYKVYVFLAAILGPLAIVASARILRFNTITTTLTAGLAILI